MELEGVKKTVIAKALGVAPNTVYRWASKGILEEKIKQYHKEAEVIREFEAFREMRTSDKEKAKMRKQMRSLYGK